MNDSDEAEHWRQADVAFDHLLDLPAPARAAALAALDLAPDVRGKVERLLGAHASTDGVLERPLRGGPAPDALAGRRLGAWTLEHEIGRGGMAVVYRAHRDEGAERRSAAIKLLTLGALAGLGPARLHNEHAMLARLNHPHIVPLFDAGVADDGTPWLAMALVDGVHIDEWCLAHGLGARAIVALLLDVCDAVAYAHQNLVIHRDLKPSNVLVDAHGHVRLLDFGISRLAGESAEATVTRHRALTPSYAAPEQFDGAAPATTMDVFGLGALLYRLLVGASPRRDAGASPPRASKAAAANGASRPHVRELRDDLDAILGKALHVDAAQRYASAGTLAADLRRWLAGRPVTAAAPATAYRLRKFIARHRLGVAASVAVMLAVAAGVAGTLWQARHARLQATQATAIKDFVLDLFAATNPDLAQGKDPPASLLLRQGATRVRSEFAARPLVRAEMLGVIGRVQLERGLFDEAQASLDEAIATFVQRAQPAAAWATAVGVRGMLAYERGDPDEALQRIQRAIGIADAAGLRRDNPQRLYLQVRQAEMQVETDEAAAAETTARSAVRTIEASALTDQPIYPDALSALATALHYGGHPQEALPVLRRAEAAQQRIAPAHPMMAVILNDLGVRLQQIGDYEQALPVLQRAVERHVAAYGPVHVQTLQVQGNVASVLNKMGRPAESAREFERLVPLVEQALGSAAHPRKVSLLGQLAQARADAGEADTALAAAREAWAMRQALPPDRRAGSEWVGGVLGLLQLERNAAQGSQLLRDYRPPDCSAIEQRTRFTRHTCIANALLTLETRTCALPSATPPADAQIHGTERDWWAAWWYVRLHCARSPQDNPDAIGAHIAALTAGRETPAWLRQHLRFAREPPDAVADAL